MGPECYKIIRSRDKRETSKKAGHVSNNYHFHLLVHVLPLRNKIVCLKNVCVQSRLPRFLHGFLVRLSTNADPESMTKAEERQHNDENVAVESGKWVDRPCVIPNDETDEKAEEIGGKRYHPPSGQAE